MLSELFVSKIIRGEIELVLLIGEQNALTDPELVAQKLVQVLNLFKCSLLFVQLTNSGQLEIVLELLGTVNLVLIGGHNHLSCRLKSYLLRLMSFLTSFS